MIMEQVAGKVATAEMRETLEQVLSLHFGRPRMIRKLRRRRSTYSSSYTIENIEVELQGGKRLSLVFKDLSSDAMLDEAKHVRPLFLYSPKREIETYRSLLDSEQLGTPVFYGAVERPEIGRYCIFLERVDGPLLWQVGRLEQWENTARWLARFHERWSENLDRARGLCPSVLQLDQAHCTLWIDRASRLRAKGTNSGAAAANAGFRRIQATFHQVVEKLMSLPKTLIHGEFYPSNIIIRADDQGGRVCPIDWEATAIGPGMLDVAALTSGDWSPDQKKRLVMAYREGIKDPGSLDEMMISVEYCQLYLAVQWLGWAADWSPPRNHQQNWLREALRLTERIGL